MCLRLVSLATFVAAILALPGCGDDKWQYCHPNGWSKIQTEADDELLGVGGSPNNVFAVGYTIMHYNGNMWRDIHHTYGATFDAWAYSENASFAVQGNRVLQYDGVNWTSTELETDMEVIDLRGVWGSSEQDVFVVGFKDDSYGPLPQYNFISHYDGVGWTEMSTGDGEWLVGIWGSSRNNVFATGTSGVFHYDGNNWNKIDTGFEGFYRSVWGSSETDVYLAGSSLLHFDGEYWTQLDTGIDQGIRTICGRSANDIYALAHEGTLYHYDGTEWNEAFRCEAILLYDVWVSPDRGVFVVATEREESVAWISHGVILYDEDR